jgi:hypothetical protein
MITRTFHLRSSLHCTSLHFTPHFLLPCAFRHFVTSGVPRIFFFVGCSTNSVEDRGQRERRSGSSSPLIRGSAQFTIRFDFVKLSGCRGLLRMYFPRNWACGSALSKLRVSGGGGGVEHPNPPPPPVPPGFRMPCVNRD